MRPSLVMVAVLSSLVLALSGARAAQQVVSTTHQMPVRLQANLETSGCENAPGPEIALSGMLELGGLGLDVIFRNNQKGTHVASDESVMNVELLPAGQGLSIPKQPVQGGVGGNPFIWFQLVGADGRAMTSAIFLGRCVQGITPVTADFFLPATAVARLAADGCYNHPGPTITLDGDVELGGLNARIMLSNNDNPVGGPHRNEDVDTADLVVVPDGQVMQIPKQPVLGGVGGNPWISVQFQSAGGEALGNEILLGRCVQLSK